MNPTLQPTRALVIHPAVKHLPMLPVDSAEAKAITESIRQIGLLEAVKLHKGRLVDGRERLRSCLELGVEQMPCVEICEGDLHTVILHSLTARKHLTKSALAYLAYPHFDKAMKEAHTRMMECLKLSPDRRGSGSALNALPVSEALMQAKTAEELAEQLGISRRLFFSARNVHGHFAKSPELREKFEGMILHGEPNADDIDTRRPYSLARVIQGIAGYESTAGGSRNDRDQLLLWNEKVKGFGDPRKWAGWEKTTPEVREYVTKELGKAVTQWPREVQEALAGQLQRAIEDAQA